MSQSNSPMQASRKNRLAVSLNHRLDHKLFGYAAAASAAGVGMMALAQPGQAEIIYTPTHQTIPPNGGVALDLNADGITDFSIHSGYNSCSTGPDCEFQVLAASGIGRNRVFATYGGMGRALALPAHHKVGPEDFFRDTPPYAMMDRCKATRTSYYISGSWRNNEGSYLGLQFSIGGEIHYGWARLNVDVKLRRCNAAVLLTGYAYETVPNKPIITGKMSGAEKKGQAQHSDATLGALAQGSEGLVAWRRDEDAD